MTDVVISYAREDRGIARKLADGLSRYGLSVDWDCDGAADARHRAGVSNARESQRAVVVLWSRYSVHNRRVLDDAVRAEQQQSLYPVLIDSIEVPIGFRHWLCADLIGWSGDAHNTEFCLLLNHLSEHAVRLTAFRSMMAVIESAGTAPSLTPTQRSIAPIPLGRRGSSGRTGGIRSSTLGLVTGGSILVGATGMTFFHLLPQSELRSAAALRNQPVASAMPAAVQTAPSRVERLRDSSAVVRLWPDEYGASSERFDASERHPVTAAFDGDRQSAWISSSTRERSPQWIEAQFAQPVLVHHIVVYNGYQRTTNPRRNLFSKYPRAKALEVSIDDDPATVAATEFLKTDQAPVTILVQRAARTIRLTMGATWPPDGATDPNPMDVSISEVELWGSHLY